MKEKLVIKHLVPNGWIETTSKIEPDEPYVCVSKENHSNHPTIEYYPDGSLNGIKYPNIHYWKYYVKPCVWDDIPNDSSLAKVLEINGVVGTYWRTSSDVFIILPHGNSTTVMPLSGVKTVSEVW